MPPSSASPPAGKLYRRRAEIAAELAQLGPPLPGSIVERHTRSAKRACRCRSDPPQLHGPYLVWTPTKNAKTVTPQRAAQLQPWIDNARRLRELVAELHQLAVDQAEQRQHYPPSPLLIGAPPESAFESRLRSVSHPFLSNLEGRMPLCDFWIVARYHKALS